ncbi:MAG TPA: Lpg1974 family pore-forming outer membrane protein [Gemmataceae bacterium]|nr:Lpg1974 family pore-forming outer membrane protein [Gemmataceae bacterium]
MAKLLVRSFLGAFLSVAYVAGAYAQNNEGSPDKGNSVFNTDIACDPKASARFETSASFLLLQPGSGNLVFATIINPLPPLTPHWNDQAVRPDFSPAFNVGARYVVDPGEEDLQLSWTHLNTFDDGSATAGSTQAVGPSFLIGPPPPYSSASSVAHFAYDVVNLDGGVFLNAGNHVQVRPFFGAQIARISQSLSTNFQSSDGAISFTDISKSSFTGAGPRLGMDMHCVNGNLDILGGIAGSLLIGKMRSNTDFLTTSPIDTSVGLIPNTQYLTSPNSTVVVPSIDARMGASYAFSVGKFGILKCEAGYQATVYINAVNQYSLTEVSGPETIPFEGNAAVFLRTAVESQSNFWVHGPYVKFSLEF